MACFTLLLALLFAGVVAQPAHAGAAAPRYAYVVDQVADAVDIFSITLANGVLVPDPHCGALNPQPLIGFGVTVPTSAKVDPTGSFLYVSDSGKNQVIGFFILPNGCLKNIVPGPWPTVGTTPSSLHISASGEFLYVSDTCISPAGGPLGCVEGFLINPNGTLVPVAGGPTIAGAAQGGIAVDPVRQYIYAADDSPAGPIHGSRFNPIAGQIPPFVANPAKTPNPHRMALDPVGKGMVGPAASQFLLVVSDPPALVVDCYILNTAAGVLGWAGAAPTGVNPHSVDVTRFGQFAYVTDNVAGTVQPYNINGCAGIAVDGAPMPTGAAPTGVTVDQTGRYVYVAASGGAQVWGYKINPNGTLANIGFWNTAAGPVFIATMP